MDVRNLIMPGGRPTKMTETTLQKLEEAFALGCSDEEACFYADIAKQTLYNYQEKNPEFVDRKEALKANPVLLARKSVVKALPDDPDLAMKFLERRKKDEFSTRAENDITTNGKDITPLLVKFIGEDGKDSTNN